MLPFFAGKFSDSGQFASSVSQSRHHEKIFSPYSYSVDALTGVRLDPFGTKSLDIISSSCRFIKQ